MSQSHEPAADFTELRLEHVSHRFGTVTAIDDLTFTVRRGEFIVLLGPSGCGKSTVLNCIAGLVTPTSGSVWLDERRIDTLRPEQRGFGMVFQNYALFPHMSVRKNIGFGLVMQHRPSAEIARRVDDVLKFVQLEGHADKLPGQLSGGQQQRVAIARAIVIAPPLILMDEPLSNLDAKLRLEMRSEIKRIHREVGRTSIYVTHDQDEALSLADRIVLIVNGRAGQIATPLELYQRPASLEVARFMGFRNAIDVTVEPGPGPHLRAASSGIKLTGSPTDGLARGRAVAAIRPDDLTPHHGREDAIRAKVIETEYRGRDYAGKALAEGGGELFFRSPQRIDIGDAIELAADPGRVLFFPISDETRQPQRRP